MPADSNYSTEHPHAHHRTWTEHQRGGIWPRHSTWTWAACHECGRRIAVMIGVPGEPECDRCGVLAP